MFVNFYVREALLMVEIIEVPYVVLDYFYTCKVASLVLFLRFGIKFDESLMGEGVTLPMFVHLLFLFLLPTSCCCLNCVLKTIWYLTYVSICRVLGLEWIHYTRVYLDKLA